MKFQLQPVSSAGRTQRYQDRPRPRTVGTLVWALLASSAILSGCGKKPAAFQNPDVTRQLKGFVSEKEAQAKVASAAGGQELIPEYKAMFAAAGKGDWQTASNVFRGLSRRAPQYEGKGPKDDRLTGTGWQAITETYGALEQFTAGGDKYVTLFGNETINSIPPGSIYFGGTDPGRWVITAMTKSHVNGDPFFTITQNALADGSYLDYVRTMYGERISTPTAEDSTKAFQDYMMDAERRIKHDQQSPNQPRQVKPGEDVKVGADGRVQVSGQIAVMSINALLAKVIFDKNPEREFYVEESFPLDWMFPNLEPHGLIMKINRRPLSTLSEEIVQEDHDYWSKRVSSMIGGWLTDETSVKDICAFVEKVYVRHDFSGFKGDREFVENEWAQKAFSKWRSSIAGIYAWRLGLSPSGGPVPPQHLAQGADRKRFIGAADFAFRQAFALCPYSPEAVFRYVNFLINQERIADAALVAETAAHLDPHNRQMQDLARRVKQLQKTK